jgi:hypothetical protein
MSTRGARIENFVSAYQLMSLDCVEFKGGDRGEFEGVDKSEEVVGEGGTSGEGEEEEE